MKTTKTIVLTGGGSGGHITPLVAVARQLKQTSPETKLVYVGQHGESLADVLASEPSIDQVFSVRAGKFRRYHGEGWRQIFALPTQLKNVRDAVWVLVGLWQSFWLIRRIKPAIIFSRGGFVSVPVALGGALNDVPYITHDSDSVPSLANRMIARWALLHAVALPEGMYPYPRQKTLMVGVPVSGDYKKVTRQMELNYRQELDLGQYEQVVCVTGGGNGARELNQAVAASAADLLKRYPRLVLIHMSGRKLETPLNKLYDQLVPTSERARVLVKGFVADFYRYSGAADLIVARGGATNLAEFALQAKACIIIPAAQLVGGHQLKNAQLLADAHAIKLISEADSASPKFGMTISQLLDSPLERQALGEALQKFARPNATRDLAELIIKNAKNKL